MLNIISNEIFKPDWLVTGQTKVFRNLIKGLDKIAYPYVLNKKHDYCSRLWIYNDQAAIDYLANVNTDNTKVIIGPVMSLDLIKNTTQKDYLKSCLVLQPSEWAKNFLLTFGYNSSPLDAWPVGIDADEFTPSSDSKEYVLIYFKQRFRFELSLIITSLKKKGIRYELIEYGSYKESEYKAKMNKARYIIWLGRQESQGIALEEALSQNIPILVWEVSCLGHWQPTIQSENDVFTDDMLVYTGAKVAVYFDNTCGTTFTDAGEIDGKIDFMENNIANFSSRNFILNNLSLEKQSREFVNLFDKHWPGLEEKSSINVNLNSWKPGLLTKIKALIYYKLKKIK